MATGHTPNMYRNDGAPTPSPSAQLEATAIASSHEPDVTSATMPNDDNCPTFTTAQTQVFSACSGPVACGHAKSLQLR
jgi:hypothetical protein